MINTLSIRDIEARADNIYEAVLVLAKRARQINSDQKQQLARDRDFEDDYDLYGEDEVIVEPDFDYPELPKPSELALEEFLEDKVEFEYQKDEEEERPSES